MVLLILFVGLYSNRVSHRVIIGQLFLKDYVCSQFLKKKAKNQYTNVGSGKIVHLTLHAYVYSPLLLFLKSNDAEYVDFLTLSVFLQKSENCQ